MKLGATGRFPEGRHGPTDEGELNFAVSSDVGRGQVRIDFGKKISWFSFGPELAEQLADSLRKHAAQIRAAKQ